MIPLTFIPSTRLIPTILEREETFSSLLTRFGGPKLDVLVVVVLLLVLLPIVGDICAKADIEKDVVDIISRNKNKELRSGNNTFLPFIIQSLYL
jgi:hypothetical protein